jgi:hypothetical protein
MNLYTNKIKMGRKLISSMNKEKERFVIKLKSKKKTF